jgi:chromosomal replication initiator protein
LIAASARDIWTSALGSLQLEVTRNNYDTWLKNTLGLDSAEGSFVVGVPNTFVAEGLQKRMSPLIERTLKGLLDRDISVAYEVYQPGTPGHKPVRNGHSANNGTAAPMRVQARSRTGDGRLNPRYTFETFVVGKSNQFAAASAVAVAENPGQDYNPLVIHAGVGLGKTHLLHAIGHSVNARGLRCLYVSAEQFTNDFVSALREASLEEFRSKYRDIDLLLIDDIQFIAGKEHSRESFFHTFNDLHTASKQVVISSDTRPKSIPLLEERLSSRLEAGLRVDIKPPDLETRMAILGKKAEQAGAYVSQEVIEFLARKIAHNVRDLEGALNRIMAMSSMTNHPVDMELAAQAVTDVPSSTSRLRRRNPVDVVETVAAYFGLPAEDLAAKTRRANIALARQVAAYLLREETSRSLADIGSYLGNRGHSTILRAHDKIAYEINVNTDLRRHITEIRDTLERIPPRAT